MSRYYPFSPFILQPPHPPPPQVSHAPLLLFLVVPRRFIFNKISPWVGTLLIGSGWCVIFASVSMCYTPAEWSNTTYSLEISFCWHKAWRKISIEYADVIFGLIVSRYYRWNKHSIKVISLFLLFITSNHSLSTPVK